MPSNFRLLVSCILGLVLPTAVVFAQQNSTPPATPNSNEAAQSLPDSPQPQNQQTGKGRFKRFEERILAGRGLDVTNDLNAAPMSPRDKFGLFVRESVDPGRLFLVGFDAGLSQATNEFEEYGQGAAGYGKRFGTSLCDEVSGEFFGTFLFPVILREDPRYYRKGSGTFRSRVGWAFKKSFTTRTDKGTWRFGYSRVLGNVAAGTLSNAYYPASDRGVGLTAQRTATITAFGIVGSLAQEFWPDVSGRLLGKKKNAPGTVDSAQKSPNGEANQK